MNELFIKEKIKQFLLEDIQHEDLTSDAIFPSTQTGTASLYAKNNGIWPVSISSKRFTTYWMMR